MHDTYLLTYLMAHVCGVELWLVTGGPWIRDQHQTNRHWQMDDFTFSYTAYLLMVNCWETFCLSRLSPPSFSVNSNLAAPLQISKWHILVNSVVLNFFLYREFPWCGSGQFCGNLGFLSKAMNNNEWIHNSIIQCHLPPITTSLTIVYYCLQKTSIF